MAIFAADERHEMHDHDPRFEAWNKRADAFQIAEPFGFGAETIVTVAPGSASARASSRQLRRPLMATDSSVPPLVRR